MTLSAPFFFFFFLSDGERKGTKEFNLTCVTTAPPLYAASPLAPALSPPSCSCFVNQAAKVNSSLEKETSLIDTPVLHRLSEQSPHSD